MILEKFSLKRKTALVTGSSRRLGAGGAIALAEAGANVAIHASGDVATWIPTIQRRLRADPERPRQIMGRIPARRWGRPGEMAGAVVFLASSASDYIHGHVLTVDGGWLSR